MSLGEIYSYLTTLYFVQFVESFPNLLIFAPVQWFSRIFFCVPDSTGRTPVPGPNDCMWNSTNTSLGTMLATWSVWTTETLGYMIIGLPMFLIFVIIYMINLGIDALHAL